MKFDLNRIIFSLAFTLFPIYIFLEKMNLDISIVELLLEACVVELFVIVFSACEKKRVAKIITVGLALVCIFIFNDIDNIKMGLGELLDSYTSLVKVGKSGNEILGDIISEGEHIVYLVRVYLEIAVVCLSLVYGSRLWKIIYVDITIPFIILILAAGITPSLDEMAILIIMYVVMVIMPMNIGANIDISKKYTKSMLIVYVAVITMVTMFVTHIYINEDNYKRSEKLVEIKNNINAYVNGDKKIELKEMLSDLLQYVEANFTMDDDVASGGLSDGVLGAFDKIEFTGKKVMDVYVEGNQSYNKYYPLYIKYYVGSEYTGNSWNGISKKDNAKLNTILEKYDITLCDLENLSAEIQKNELYYTFFADTYDKKNSYYNDYTVTIALKNSKAKDYYWVYNADKKTEMDYDGQRSDLDSAYNKQSFMVHRGADIPSYYDMTYIRTRTSSYPYYDESAFMFLSNGEAAAELDRLIAIEKDYERLVNQIYTKIPESFEEIANTLRRATYNFNGSELIVNRNVDDLTSYMGYEPYIKFVQEYLSSRCTYTLEPGKLNKGEDFVNKFLLETNEGYCTHFASAGVLIFRSLGIPARYATGYVVQDGIGEYGKAWTEVKDDAAHAWVEIYISGLGWRPVEVTPSGYRDVIEEAIGGTDVPEETTKDTSVVEPTTTITEEPDTTEEEESTTTEIETDGEEETTDGSEETTEYGQEGGTEDSTEMSGDGSESKTSDKSSFIKTLLIILTILVVIIGIINYIIVRRSRKIKRIKELLGSEEYNEICNVMLKELLILVKILGRKIDLYDTVANLARLIDEITDVTGTEINYSAARTIYKGVYGKENITKNEASDVVEVVCNAITYQYSRSNILRKTYMSYIKCLYLCKK